MDEARIAMWLAPFLADDGKEVTDLLPAQLRYISMYIDILTRWNHRVNLTSVREPEEIVTRHFGESIFAARHLFSKASTLSLSRQDLENTKPHVIDVGSGAGFPGLPIKIWAPQVHLTLIESNQKKATFLREVVRLLALTDVEVFAGRADVFPKGEGDVVTLRAVERFETILPIAAGLTGPAGCLAILVGESQLGKVGTMAPAVKWTNPIPIPLSNKRLLVLGSK